MAIQFLNTVAVDTNVLYVDTINDRVGIGTANPSTKLDVDGGYLRVGENTAGTASEIILDAPSSKDSVLNFHQVGSQVGKLGYDASLGGIAFVSGTSSFNSADMVIKDNGNVGIGTSSPAGKLAIKDGNVYIDRDTTSGNYAFGFYRSGAERGRLGFDYSSSTLNLQADGQMTFLTSGENERMRIDSSGNVGIGTTSPGYKLDVNGQGNFSDYLNVNSSTGIKSTGWLHLHRYGSSTNVAVGNNGTNVNLYVPNGNVGIGTTSPDALLDVGANNIITLDDTGSSTGFIGMGSYNDGTKNRAQGTSYYGFGLEIDRPNQNISFNSYDSNGVLTAGTNILALKRTGEVGIGTTDPSNGKLQIDSASNQISIETGTSGDGRLHIGHFSNGTFIGTYGDDGGAADIIRFGTHSGDERMRIDSSGNVGIGNAPTKPLTINKNQSETVVLVQSSDTGVSGIYLGGQSDSIKGGLICNNSDNSIKLQGYNNATRLFVKSNGNIGIGTTFPFSKLEIAGDTSNALLTVKSNSGGVNDAFMRFYDESNGPSYSMGLDSSDNKFKIAFDYDGNSLTSGTKLVITEGGNVGIGTDNPAELLTVSGSDDVSIRINSTKNGTWTTNQKLGALEFFGNDTSGEGAAVKANISATSKDTFGSAFNMTFGTTDGTNGISERLRIGSAGQIGIGGANYGTSGQVLTSNGSGSAPSWQAAGGVTNYLRDDAFDSGIGLYLQGGSFNAGTDTATTPLVIDEEDFILTKDGGYLRKLIGKTSDQIQIGQGGTSLISSINFLPGTGGNSAVKINSNTVWNAGNDGSGSGLDADLLDGQQGTYYAVRDQIRSLGTPAFTNGTNPNITTAQVMDEIDSDGGFDSYSSVFKTSWSYAGNYNLTDAGRFTETAGSSWITWTDNSSDSTRGNITALAIAPNTGGSYGKVFIYNDQGSGYSPGWREVWTSTSDGSGSGLDADLLDGNHASAFLTSESDTLSTVLARGNTTTTGATFYGNGIIAQVSSGAGGFHSNGYIVGVASSYGKPAMYLHGNGFTVTSQIEYGYANTGIAFRKTSNVFANAITFGDHNGNPQGSISVSGTTTTYNTTSDYRLKENVIEITDGIDRVKQLQPKRFNFISEPDVVVDGFIAHEAQEVVPEAVTGEKDSMQEVVVTPAEYDEEGNVITEAVMGTKESYQGIDQSKIVPLLTAALQDAITKIENLETRIQILENK